MKEPNNLGLLVKMKNLFENNEPLSCIHHIRAQFSNTITNEIVGENLHQNIMVEK